MGFVFRPLTGAATRLRRQAFDLAREASNGGLLHRFYEIFLIRANGKTGNSIATVIETPTYLLGGFGGQNPGSDYYAHTVAVDFGPLVDAITRETVRIVDGQPVPNLPLDEFKARLPWGDGRLSIGSLPDWGDLRDALNDSTGVYVVTPSAVLMAVCPSLVDEDTADHPWLRSLVICRANGVMSDMPIFYDGKQDPPVQTNPGVPTGHPALNPAIPVGRPERISGLEIAQSELSLGPDDELGYAGPCIEWGPLEGLACVLVRTVNTPFGSVMGNELRFVRWLINDAGVDTNPRYTATLPWVTTLAAADLPTLDQPDPLSAVVAADPLYTYPGWALARTTIEGRDASDGRLLMRDPNTYLRMHTPLVGFAAGAVEAVLALVEVQSTTEGATVSVRGYYDDGVNPVQFNTVSVPANFATRWITYVAEIDAAGALSLTKLEEFLDSRYVTTGALARNQIQAYGGFTTGGLTPEPRLFCSEWAVQYEVLPADPDGPGPYNIQGEPARKVPADYSTYVRLDDLEFYMLDGSGVKTPLNLGVYYPMLYHINTSAAGTGGAPTDGRIGFGNSAFYDTTPRYGNNSPLPICQFAPGMVAVLVAPRSGYAATSQSVRVAVFDVESGALKALSPVLAILQLPAILTLSCMEQGTVVDGDLTSYGRLLMSVSTDLTSPGRSDGIFAITGLNKLTWVAREPSNIPAVYGGNGLVPSTLGVSTNLTFVKPTPL